MISNFIISFMIFQLLRKFGELKAITSLHYFWLKILAIFIKSPFLFSFVDVF